MTEYERIREEALLTDKEIRSAILGITDFELLFAKQAAQAQVDKALKTDGIEIRAENQDLPELNLPTLSGNKSLEITITSFAKKIRGDMLKAGFIKVIPKGR